MKHKETEIEVDELYDEYTNDKELIDSSYLVSEKSLAEDWLSEEDDRQDRIIIEMYKQGDIIVVKFPFTDGSEFKKRPALIISNETVNKTNDYLIVQITSKINIDKLSVPIENADCLNLYLLKASIRVHKIFTVHHSLILSKITSAKLQFTVKIAGEIYNLISPRQTKLKGA